MRVWIVFVVLAVGLLVIGCTAKAEKSADNTSNSVDDVDKEVKSIDDLSSDVDEINDSELDQMEHDLDSL